jgi:predicted N-acetyltransferase YhbS
MASLSIRPAIDSDAEAIVAVTNDAFMADAFFKKPEAILRFSLDGVTKMIREERSIFLLAELPGDGANQVCGSIFLHWDFSEAKNDVPMQFIGKFSAVSVPTAFGRRGIGQALVAAAEKHLIDLANHLSSPPSSSSSPSVPLSVVMEMGVINARQDLFPWYKRQGYSLIGPLLPNPPDLQALIADGHDIHCVLMRKVLQ